MATDAEIKQAIDAAIKLACKIENRPNDVKYQYRIIGDDLLFAIQSTYLRVRRRVEFRLLKVVKRDLGMNFNLVFPDPMHENHACVEATKYDLITGAVGIDPNHTIDRWEVFGKIKYIRAFMGVRPSDELGVQHLNALTEHGYVYDTVDSAADTYRKYVEAYQAAYGCTPLEGYLEVKSKKSGAV